MARAGELVLGLDIGTGGVRAVAADADGALVAHSRTALEPGPSAGQPGLREQDPDAWWRAAVDTLRQLGHKIARGGHRPEAIAALCVDGTSGTLVCLDAWGGVLRPAIMHNDQRAADEADELSRQAAAMCRKLGYRVAPSFAAAKILWLRRHEPAVFEATRWFAHQADYIAGRLAGEHGVTDYSNALKTGFDLIDDEWPSWWGCYDGVVERLPRVVAPGAPIGILDTGTADVLGLPAGIALIAGATDGTAAFLASGASEAGADNTTLGTTLVFKRLSRCLRADADGLVYSHKLPGGFWLPGAASSTGGEWIEQQFADADLGRLDREAGEHLPSDHVAYPLAAAGERFPFLAPGARGFCAPPAEDPVAVYAANLQGTAFVERLSYDVLDRTTGVEGRDIYATGGASRSDVWLQLRADVTGRCVRRPVCAESAFGSAVLAAASTWHGDWWSAAKRMVSIERSFEPERSQAAAYDDRFGRFCRLLEERGYTKPERGVD